MTLQKLRKKRSSSSRRIAQATERKPHQDSPGAGSELRKKTAEAVRFRHRESAFLGASGMEMSIQSIRKAIRTRPEVLHYIHHKKMEELVALIMSERYTTLKVTVCGRTRDGGIDMILAPAGRPIAVQVKRRTKPDSIEPVASVREFLGTCLLRGFSKCLYVTTAAQFSRMARREAERAVAMKLVDRFELVERGRLLWMLSESEDPRRSRYHSFPH